MARRKTASATKKRRDPGPQIEVTIGPPTFPRGLRVTISASRSRITFVLAAVFQTAKRLRGLRAERIAPQRGRSRHSVTINIDEPIFPSGASGHVSVPLGRLEDAILDMLRLAELLVGREPTFPWSDQIPDAPHVPEQKKVGSDTDDDPPDPTLH